jgi:hypothetical protein
MTAASIWLLPETHAADRLMRAQQDNAQADERAPPPPPQD